MKKAIFIIALVGMVVGLGWTTIIHFQNWDRVLSDMQKFELNHHPIILMVVCGVVLFFTQDDINK